MSEQKENSLVSQAKFWKGQPSWNKTIYILGLPRSGKSTIFNVLASCDHVEALDEPFDLIAMAQKASEYTPGSNEYMQFQDLYAAYMENHFSELVLGRSYNLRKQDKSCIYNYKTIEHVDNAHKRARRIDVINYTKSAQNSFVIALNDVEKSIDFISSFVPGVVLVHVKRDIFDIAHDIAEKNWLSDEQLSTQTNLAPAYNSVRKHKSKTIYVPYLIPPEHADLFLSLDNLERSLMYATIQDKALTHGISGNCLQCWQVNFEDMVDSPDESMSNLIEKVGLSKGQMTEQNIESVRKIKSAGGSSQTYKAKISSELNNFLAEF